MFGNLGLHVIQFPSGRWGYVGRIPFDLCEMVPATKADIMAMRAVHDDKSNWVAPKAPTFETEAEARAFAEAKGFKVDG